MDFTIDDSDELELHPSVLFNIEPLGLDTGQLESLTSYMIRLADLHSIPLGTLFNKIIAPSLDKEYILQSIKRGGNRFFDAAKSINGINETSKDLIKVLENLTSRNDLVNLTFNNWDSIFTSRLLLKPSLFWCPLCLQDFEDKDIMYIPLVWLVRAVNICAIHNVVLISTCRTCMKEIPILHRNSKIGICPYCNSSLKDSLPVRLEINEEKEQFIAINTADIILCAKSLVNNVSREIYKKKLEDISNRFFNGNNQLFRKEVGIAKVTFYDWITGKTIPTFDKVLDICYYLGINLIEFFFEKELVIKIRQTNHLTTVKKQKRRKLDYQALGKTLQEFLALEHPESVQAIAEKIGVSKRLLYKNLPQLCNTLSNRYSEYIKNCSELKTFNNQIKIKDAVDSLLEEGDKPTQRNVENYLKANSFLREESLKSFWKKYLKILDIM